MDLLHFQERVKSYPIGLPHTLKNKLRDIFSSENSVWHYGWHMAANAGDTALYPCTRDAVAAFSRMDILWRPVSLSRQLMEHHNINERARAVLVGGGGLLLCDTNQNDLSGWQWRASMSSIKSLKIPLVLFAVGYNKFRGQKEFDNIFQDHLCLTVERASFFGLRNTGSIKAVAGIVGKSLANKLSYQPCATTILGHLYPSLGCFERPAVVRRIGVNFAFDRPHLRFGDEWPAIRMRIVRLLSQLAKDGFRIDYMAHHHLDIPFYFDLRRSGVECRLVNLYKRPPFTIYKKYLNVSIVIGMRGHGQMIPFGLHRPIISLISHDKMRWFLDDIDRVHWGIEINSKYLEECVLGQVGEICNDPSKRQDDIRQISTRLAAITMKNVNRYKNLLQ